MKISLPRIHLKIKKVFYIDVQIDQKNHFYLLSKVVNGILSSSRCSGEQACVRKAVSRPSWISCTWLVLLNSFMHLYCVSLKPEKIYLVVVDRTIVRPDLPLPIGRYPWHNPNDDAWVRHTYHTYIPTYILTPYVPP